MRPVGKLDRIQGKDDFFLKGRDREKERKGRNEKWRRRKRGRERIESKGQ